jgi:hypothetical protein
MKAMRTIISLLFMLVAWNICSLDGAQAQPCSGNVPSSHCRRVAPRDGDVAYQANKNPLAFSADPSFQQDSTQAFLQTIAAANANPTAWQNTYHFPVPLNQSVWCPSAAQMQLSNQLLLPMGVSLLGNNYQDCQLNLISTNTTIQTSGVINTSNGSAAEFGTLVQGVTMNMNQQNGIAFDCIACNDATGYQDDFAYRVMTGPCYEFDGTKGGGSVNTFRMISDQCMGDQTRAAGGDGIYITGQTYPPMMDLVDVDAYSGHLFTNYIHFNNAYDISLHDATLEDAGGASDGNASVGIFIDGAENAATIQNVTEQNIGTLLGISPSTQGNVFATSLVRINGTNTVVNAGNCGPEAQTITTAQLDLYTCGAETDFDVNTQNFWSQNFNLKTINFNLAATGNVNLSGTVYITGNTNAQNVSLGSAHILNVGQYTVATLPSSPGLGAIAMITDGSRNCAAAAAPVGGGSHKCFVGWNGAWKEFGI